MWLNYNHLWGSSSKTLGCVNSPSHFHVNCDQKYLPESQQILILVCLKIIEIVSEYFNLYYTVKIIFVKNCNKKLKSFTKIIIIIFETL